MTRVFSGPQGHSRAVSALTFLSATVTLSSLGAPAFAQGDPKEWHERSPIQQVPRHPGQIPEWDADPLVCPNLKCPRYDKAVSERLFAEPTQCSRKECRTLLRRRSYLTESKAVVGKSGEDLLICPNPDCTQFDVPVRIASKKNLPRYCSAKNCRMEGRRTPLLVRLEGEPLASILSWPDRRFKGTATMETGGNIPRRFELSDITLQRETGLVTGTVEYPEMEIAFDPAGITRTRFTGKLEGNALTLREQYQGITEYPALGNVEVMYQRDDSNGLEMTTLGTRRALLEGTFRFSTIVGEKSGAVTIPMSRVRRGSVTSLPIPTGNTCGLHLASYSVADTIPSAGEDTPDIPFRVGSIYLGARYQREELLQRFRLRFRSIAENGEVEGEILWSARANDYSFTPDPNASRTYRFKGKFAGEQLRVRVYPIASTKGFAAYRETPEMEVPGEYLTFDTAGEQTWTGYVGNTEKDRFGDTLALNTTASRLTPETRIPASPHWGEDWPTRTLSDLVPKIEAAFDDSDPRRPPLSKVIRIGEWMQGEIILHPGESAAALPGGSDKEYGRLLQEAFGKRVDQGTSRLKEAPSALMDKVNKAKLPGGLGGDVARELLRRLPSKEKILPGKAPSDSSWAFPNAFFGGRGVGSTRTGKKVPFELRILRFVPQGSGNPDRKLDTVARSWSAEGEIRVGETTVAFPGILESSLAGLTPGVLSMQISSLGIDLQSNPIEGDFAPSTSRTSSFLRLGPPIEGAMEGELFRGGLSVGDARLSVPGAAGLRPSAPRPAWFDMVVGERLPGIYNSYQEGSKKRFFLSITGVKPISVNSFQAEGTLLWEGRAIAFPGAAEGAFGHTGRLSVTLDRDGLVLALHPGAGQSLISIRLARPEAGVMRGAMVTQNVEGFAPARSGEVVIAVPKAANVKDW